jgi:hypothetical protein
MSLLLASLPVSTAVSPLLLINLVTRKRASLHGVDAGTACVELLVSVCFLNQAATAVLLFTIVNNDVGFEVILGSQWETWCVRNKGVYYMPFFSPLVSVIVLVPCPCHWWTFHLIFIMNFHPLMCIVIICVTLFLLSHNLNPINHCRHVLDCRPLSLIQSRNCNCSPFLLMRYCATCFSLDVSQAFEPLFSIVQKNNSVRSAYCTVCRSALHALCAT